MKTDYLETAIEALTKKSESAEKPNDAMQWAQAALNMSHALATLKNTER